MGSTAEHPANWAFFTKHMIALLMIAADPQIRIRDMAAAIGITERAAQSIVTHLCEAGYVQRAREGRRNRYTINPDRPIQLPGRQPIPVQALLDLFAIPRQVSDMPAAAPAPV
ncbi:hypothetical protein GCM10010149_06710 [Nonomuraea roseoviolacea subsp. roseoviolacea]|uniref:MarR family transcriptional regulator n=1 Tax=Nonomuraea roseoviolacea TaxID=103837 RepID=UPI0031DA10EC